MDRIRTLAEAESFLEGLINVERDPAIPYRRLDLEPIRRLLAGVGAPHADLAVIHIAGSKGKGSTALLCEAVLGAAGVRTGTFTSPHLESWTERFRIDGEDVSGADLAAAVEQLRPRVQELRRQDPERAPSFFDVTTAAALLLFREAGVERAVLEVGLGGRLDSTNVVTPRVTCVTSIELEHTDKLGETLAAIAGEKAGIVKPGVPVVVGALAPEARAVVAERARQCGAPLAVLGEHFDVTATSLAQGLRAHFVDAGLELQADLPLVGRHQAQNAALALAILCRDDELRRRLGDEALARAAAAGFAAAQLPGRIEVLGRDPLVVIDGAHTAVSARALAAALAELGNSGAGARHLVLSVSAGKDLDAVLQALLPHCDVVTATCADEARSLPAEAIAAAIEAHGGNVGVRCVPDPRVAVRSARRAVGPSDSLCVTGSIYVAGVARSVLAESRTPRRGSALERKARADV